VCLLVTICGCKHKGEIRAQIEKQVPRGFIEGGWESVTYSGQTEGTFEEDGEVCCEVTVTVKGTVDGKPYEAKHTVKVCIKGKKGGKYKLDCSDPLLLQFPEDAKGFTGTYASSLGDAGALEVMGGLSCVSVGPGAEICAESGQQLVLVGLPPGLPPAAYYMHLDFDLDYSRPIDVKAIYTGKVTCDDDETYYPILFPCVSSFTDLPALTIPVADVPALILPPLDGLTSCDGFVDCQAPPPCPSVLYVDRDANGAGDGTSWTDAYTDLQDALDAAAYCAAPVSELWVAEGTYRPDRGTGDRTASFVLQSGVGIYGGFDGTESARDDRDPAAHPTVLSGDLSGDDGADFANYDENSYHVVSGSGTGSSAVLDGFTITGGNADGSGPPDYTDAGGGIRIESGSPTIRNCTVLLNRAYFGGGVELFFASPRIEDCQITGNRADKYGGGLHNNRGNPTLRRVRFSENSAGESGGGTRFIASDASASELTFENNSAKRGAAAHLDKGSNPTLMNIVMRANEASRDGGAIHVDRGSSPLLVNLLIEGNRAAERGGAMCAAADSASMPTLVNCTLSSNRAATAGGVYVDKAAPELSNTVLYFNEDDGGMDESAQLYNGGGSVAIDYSDVQGWTGNLGGTGNIGADPKFIDAGHWDDAGTPGDKSDDSWVSGDARLDAGSPCIDAGDNAALPPDSLDLDGDSDANEPVPLDLSGGARQLDDPGTADSGGGSPPMVDLGAHEFVPRFPRGDMNCDGSVDLDDIDGFVAALISQEGYEDDYPDCLYLNGDINLDGSVDMSDIDGFVACIISGGCP
jgi:hypothetical protein